MKKFMGGEPSMASTVMKKFNVSAPKPKMTMDAPMARPTIAPSMAPTMAPKRAVPASFLAHQFKKKMP